MSKEEWVSIKDAHPKGLGYYKVLEADRNVEGIAVYNPGDGLWVQHPYNNPALRAVTHWKLIDEKRSDDVDTDSIFNLRRQFIEDMTAVGAGEIALYSVEKLTEWGFFTMPASTRYHGTNEGDLFRHSRTVATTLKNITDACEIKWQNTRSPILVGYFHDLCKCDCYQRPVKAHRVDGHPVVDTNSWEHRNDQVLSGHGDKSVMLASLLCRLTEEEMLCIRYHMGAYNTEDWDVFDRAIRKYQTVAWTHQADMLASKVVGV